MINIDARSSTPIYEQIILGIKELIIKEIISPGDKLPSVREMANMLTTNPQTVSKAYNELERLNIIETLRGKGTYVSMEYKPKLEEEKMLKFKKDLKKLLMDAHYMGLNENQINLIFKEVYVNLLGTDHEGGSINE
ncbi:GntR family transcriptional regulator [Inconstantimicrobium mannanitabidum]|uniref:GntR family transcriptional regulator n=1 Tax=Inconstantimicrobium mannanitabidum TaxID=1604901 RepID=UPI0021C48F13|nr:GntR family transcriptional regulator [Clostridium sp. TW13]